MKIKELIVLLTSIEQSEGNKEITVVIDEGIKLAEIQKLITEKHILVGASRGD